MIRLLNGQMERADKRISALTISSRSLRTSRPPSPPSEQLVEPTSPLLQNGEFVDTSPESSPRSLVSFESSIRRGSDESERSTFDIDIGEERSEVKEPEEEIKTIRVPFKLEHSPKTNRRESLLDQLSPPPTITSHRVPLYSERRRSQIPSKGHSTSTTRSIQTHLPSNQHSKIVTPAVSRVHAMSKGKLPPTPDDTPVALKSRPQHSPSLRNRIFRSKSDILDQEPTPIKESPQKTISKKSSFINFWKPKATATQTKETRPSVTIETVTPIPEKSGKTRIRESSPQLALPHESDKLSRYPKVRPVSVATSATSSGSQTKEWRQSIGRQVSEMVQHWEDESSKRTDTGSISSKRASSTMTDISSLAVKAARDAWTAKANSSGSMTGKTSIRERNDKWRRSRDELVRKLGLSTIPPNAAAA